MAKQEPTPDHVDVDHPGTPAESARGELRELVLEKHGRRFIFRYSPGGERELLASLVEMARDPESDFEWFDAAVISHQMGTQLGDQLARMLKAS